MKHRFYKGISPVIKISTVKLPFTLLQMNDIICIHKHSPLCEY